MSVPPDALFSKISFYFKVAMLITTFSLPNPGGALRRRSHEVCVCVGGEGAGGICLLCVSDSATNNPDSDKMSFITTLIQ